MPVVLHLGSYAVSHEVVSMLGAVYKEGLSAGVCSPALRACTLCSALTYCCFEPGGLFKSSEFFPTGFKTGVATQRAVRPIQQRAPTLDELLQQVHIIHENQHE